MVVFTCQHCGESVNKPKVEKHYSTRCRYKTPNLTCVDCLKDFIGDAYDSHTQCMTEAERYSKKGTIFKENTGRNKQLKYIEMIQNLLNTTRDLSNDQRRLLELCSQNENVPRKQQKFVNFMNNIARHIRPSKKDLEVVFQIIEEGWKKEVQVKKNDPPQVANSALEETSNNSILSNGEQEDINKIQQTDTETKKKKKKSLKLSKIQDSQELSFENDSCNGTNKEKFVNGEESQTNDMPLESCNNNEETKENLDRESKKKIKKQKKYEKYLKELENEAKAKQEINENCDGEYEEKINMHKKSKKRAKASFEEGTSLDSKCAMEVESQDEPKLKKSKKRKNDDAHSEIDDKKIKTDPSIEETDVKQNTSFDWADIITRILESRPDKELSLKKLGKKVVNEYQTVKADHHTYEELLAKFNKKVMRTRGVKVLKDKAKITE